MNQNTSSKLKVIQDQCRDIARLQTWGDIQSTFYCTELPNVKDVDGTLATVNEKLNTEKQLKMEDFGPIDWASAWKNIHDSMQYGTDGEDTMMNDYEKRLKDLLDTQVDENTILYSITAGGIEKLVGFHPTWWGFGFLGLNSNNTSFLLCGYGYE